MAVFIHFRPGCESVHAKEKEHIMKTDWIFNLFDMKSWKTFLRETD